LFKRWLSALVVLASMTSTVACSPSPSADAGADGGAEENAGRKDSGAHDASTDGSEESRDGSPSLTELRISESDVADASPEITLSPPFSPDIHDYYVRCPAAANALVVSMVASRGSESMLTRPTTSGASPKQTLDVSVLENQAIVAVATDGKTSVEYWVRCLPSDFPMMQWTLHPEAGAPTPGYYLLGTRAPRPGNYAFMLDSHGVPVWYAASTSGGGAAVFDVDNVVTGAVSYFPTPGPTFEIRQLDPVATTYVQPTGQAGDEHELRHLSNGDFLEISSGEQTGVDLSGMNIPLEDGGVQTLSGLQTILACNILEITPDGTVVWSWKATDHFDPVLVTTSPEPSGNVFGVFHCNSIDIDPANENLLVSARDMNSIFYIEKSSGRVVWKMGGTPYSIDDATYVAVSDPFVCQHDARLLPGWSATCSGGSGQVSVFDDATGESRSARGVVYDVTAGTVDGGTSACGDGGGVDAGDGGALEGGKLGASTVAWQYPGTTQVATMGSFRISPDGSRVICWGTGPPFGFTEVDLAKHDLLDFVFTDGDSTYRAIKIPLTAFDLEVLRDTAGLP
jgi:hypothetical protein